MTQLRANSFEDSFRLYAVELSSGHTAHLIPITARWINHAISGDFDTLSILADCLVDETGNRLFANGDARKIQQWPLSIVQELVAELNRISGLDDSDEPPGKARSGP